MMKNYLIILFLFTSIICYGQFTEDFPQYEFYSTSVQLKTDDAQYTVPFAAGNINNEPYSPFKSPRRVISGDDSGFKPGYDPSDPPAQPIGDGIIELLVLSLLWILGKLYY